MRISKAARQVVAEETETADLLRQKANEHEANGNHRQERVYRNAAAKADDRAALWRGLSS